MRSLFSIFILCFVFTSFLYSNTAEILSYTISGFVYDEETEEPIPGASVYLSGTTIGTQTLQDGSFSFTTSYQGGAKLVVSFVGYDSKSEDVLLSSSGSAGYTFFLKARITELNEIVVTSSNKEWQNSYRLFREFFIGEGRFSRSVQLRNPEVLNFDEEENGLVKVTASNPLIIINRALGYRVEADIIDVAFNKFDKTGAYKIYTNYAELPRASDAAKRRWANNRKTVYEGSSMHFYRSLVEGTHLKEGFSFLTREGGKIVAYDDLNVLTKHYPKLWNPLREHYSIFELSESQVVVGYGIRFDMNRNIENPNNLTYISYAGSTPFFLVDSNGLLYDPAHLKYIGKWAREKASDLLPTDYDPNK
ncbi:MAG: carboxypeptidase-like regulatory domain-containing protein [Balneolaceae bacterium]|nr:carboxypeptidase-like regulatory domain-containing protein [Balneolaceae bacterium]MBO6545768.1 carboxypeptidase-like regulatory domain-containing protein [Balneolaceae bacterium]MBO6647164.1 carboxypeptidase-like regulatory domain-containing protein [Balneolaceae bacterium]